MGAIRFLLEVDVANASTSAIESAHCALLQEAILEDPHDSYDGSISTCEGWELRRVFDEGTNPDEIRSFIDLDVENARKWEAAFVVVHGRTAHFYGWAAT